jgi:hypothetical protein
MNFLKLNVVNALPAVTSADAGARVLFENSIYVVTSAGSWKEVGIEAEEVKEYIATMSQSTTENPVVNVIKNTLGVTVAWTREFPGSIRYNGVYSEELPSAPFVQITGSYRTAGTNILQFSTISVRTTTQLAITVVNASGSIVEMASDSAIQIRISLP